MNFIFVIYEKVNGKFFYEFLKDNGILVRYFNKDRIDNYLRIIIGIDNEMNVLIEKIKIILENL